VSATATENAFIKSVIDSYNSNGGLSPSAPALKAFVASLDFTKYWSYDGSLTTPPCSEEVTWNVLKTTQTITAAQLSAFSTVLNANAKTNGTGNNRVVNPLGSRVLYHEDARANLVEKKDSAMSTVATAGAALAAISALAF